MPSLPVLVSRFCSRSHGSRCLASVPAWSASRPTRCRASGAGRSTPHTTILRKSMVVLQAALSVVLLSAAGLRSNFAGISRINSSGFQMEGNVVVV